VYNTGVSRVPGPRSLQQQGAISNCVYALLIVTCVSVLRNSRSVSYPEFATAPNI